MNANSIRFVFEIQPEKFQIELEAEQALYRDQLSDASA